MSDSSQQFKCPVRSCSRIFTTSKDLDYHEQTIHGKKISCPQPKCNYRGTRPKYMKHRNKKHCELTVPLECDAILNQQYELPNSPENPLEQDTDQIEQPAYSDRHQTKGEDTLIPRSMPWQQDVGSSYVTAQMSGSGYGYIEGMPPQNTYSFQAPAVGSSGAVSGSATWATYPTHNYNPTEGGQTYAPAHGRQIYEDQEMADNLQEHYNWRK